MWLHDAMGVRRLFLAVHPPVAQLVELQDFLDDVGFAGAGLKLVTPDKWHITLSFMPGVQLAQAEALHDALIPLAANTRPLDLRLEGAGFFPPTASSTPTWIGVRGDLDSLSTLALGCRSAGRRSGTRVESSKKFRPHLTLARHSPSGHPEVWLQRLDQFRGIPWTVTELLLVESTLRGFGNAPVYDIVESYKLSG